MEKKRKKGKKRKESHFAGNFSVTRAITRYVLSAFGKFVEIRFS